MSFTQPRIIHDPTPRLEGHRIGIHQIVGCYLQGWTLEELEEGFRLTLEEIHTALAYYYGHQEEIDALIEEMAQRDAEIKGKYPTPDDVVQAELENYITVKEVARLFGRSESAVYKAINEGKLPHRKSESTIIIRRIDAENLWST